MEDMSMSTIMTILTSLSVTIRRSFQSIVYALRLVKSSHQIVLVRSRAPGKIGNGHTKRSVTEWIEEVVPSLAGEFKPSWWLPR